MMRTKKKQAIDWLFPEVRKRVLSLLLVHPEQRWYLLEHAQQFVKLIRRTLGKTH